MAQVLPRIQINDTRHGDGSPTERQDTGKFSIKGEGSVPSGKLASKLQNGTASPTTTTAYSDQAAAQPKGTTISAKSVDSRSSAPEAPIDPLSQQILKRTNTALSQKLRTQIDSSALQSPSSPVDILDAKQAPESTREIGNGSYNKPDKRKGVSFLSRFIGNKKKGTVDGATDDGSDPGDAPRPEGMDAQLFRHTIDNMGFSPKYPQPPAYIKVRTKFKKEKEFDRIFLAQELRCAADRKSISVPHSGSTGNQNPIWATEFSKDGKFLAAGGQDKIVRVWSVISTPEERRAQEKDEGDPDTPGDGSTRLSAPVFQQKPVREYEGHTSTILDLSWSKNNFLLSSSMDKTVRLWHISRAENLCTFKHTDFVPSIQFHPRDDRFFLAGSLDCKLRLWSIPDKSVAFWNQLPDMITAVSFTPDGKTGIAGTLSGLCMFYETEGLKYQTQIHVKSTRGQNAKGSKITGIQAAYWPPGSDRGEVKLLISSNDSRIRLYNLRDKSLEIKFRGHQNSCSQIRASFADDTGNIVCGSEDRKTYIWSTGAPEGERRNQRPVEMFEAHNSITTCAVMAPLKTRLLLAASEDPIFDLCNPPPVTLVSRAESVASSRPATDGGSAMPTPATDMGFKRVAETPAYLARSAHKDGNIIVTADYTGAIKVFRQDCAYTKRLRVADNWDASSVFSKRTGSKIGRPSSLFSKAPSSRPRRDSTSTQPADDRIMSWRQDISHGSFDSASVAGSIPTPRRSQARSRSPRKSRLSVSSANARPVQIVDRDTPALVPALTNESGKPASAPPGLLPAEPSLKTSSSMERMSSARASDDVDVSVSGESSSAAAATPAVETEVEVETQGKRERTRPGQLHIHTGSDIGLQSQTQVTTLNKASTNSSFFQAPLSGAAQTPRSWAFWNRTPTVPGFPGSKRERERAEGDMRAATGLGRSSSQAGSEEEEEVEEEEEEEDGVVCRACGADEFRVRLVKSGVSGSVGASGSVSSGPREERKLVCGRCGVLAG